MAGLRPIPRLAPRVVKSRLDEWRRLLRRSVTQGRAVLQRILKGRIVFTPTEHGYEFSAETRFDRLFSGIAVQFPSYIDKNDNRGKECITPEDTLDADYERLLKRVQARHEKKGKGVVGLEGLTWNQIQPFLRELGALRGAA